MKLISLTVENYRRFVKRTSVKLNGPLVALVGPNEAGKSSALRALQRLDDDSPFGPDELPRRREGLPEIAWQFELEPEDIEALTVVPEAAGVTRVTLTRTGADQVRRWSYSPHPIIRDATRRNEVLGMLLAQQEVLTGLSTTESIGLHLEDLADTLRALNEAPADFEAEQLAAMRRLRAGLEHAATEGDAAQGDDGPAPWLEKLAEEVRTLVEYESQDGPAVLARKVLIERLPRVVTFREADRQLASSYDLEEVVDDPPPALLHLAKLADLDLDALLGEAQSGALADVGTRRNAANRRLMDIFDKAWNQQGIAIQIEIQGSILHIQATTPEDAGLSSIDERSDGLRWFAALLAYASGWADRPILLVDEIETHLHYDAQSDLIGVLSQQEFTSKVIYTTHSFGCLPPDLGTGVRVVEQLDSATSRFENGFWKRGAGFSPLLASMGAAAVSLTPTRYAVLAEGPSEAILLPALLRQALNADALRYQVAPGVAGVAALGIEELDAEAGRVAFLVDGDDGGLAIRDKLTRGGIDETRIITLFDDGSHAPLEIEDLVDPDEYLQAVNDELRLWQSVDLQMSRDDLGSNFATKSVEKWATANSVSAPDKAAVAQRLADLAGDRRIVNDGRLSTLIGLDEKTRTILRLATS